MSDVSKRTVLILLILVILSTVISTWAFLSTITAPQKVYLSTPKSSSSDGVVELEVRKPPLSTATGEVQLEIVKPDGG
jgi:hypothetical protein